MRDVKALLREAADTLRMYHRDSLAAKLDLAAAEKMGEPVAWVAISEFGAQHCRYARHKAHLESYYSGTPDISIAPLYAAPPPAVPEGITAENVIPDSDEDLGSGKYCDGYADGWNACRDAVIATTKG